MPLQRGSQLGGDDGPDIRKVKRRKRRAPGTALPFFNCIVKAQWLNARAARNAPTVKIIG